MAQKSSRMKPKETPIDRELLKKAEGFARDYHIVIESHERAGYMGTSLEIPTVFSTGATPDKCVSATQQALTVAIAAMMEAGVNPPKPYVERKRDEQMNIRIDAEEKLLLKQAANRQGFSSISEFVRVTVLRNARDMLRHENN